jgi:heterodisulfide reductase subunit D
MNPSKMGSEEKEILKEIIKGCYQCGVCTGCCPLGYFIPYKPSLYIYELLLGDREKVLKEGNLWTCLTCAYCYEKCPQNVNFPEMVKDARAEMVNKFELRGEEAHDSIFSLFQKMMADESLQRVLPDYVIPEGVEVAETGEVAYFIGCLPFFDTQFRPDIGFNGLSIAHDTFRILSALLDEPPVILRKEKCCGHDALWRGDADVFMSLAKQNIEVIKASGAKKVVTSCAEGYMALKREYPKYFDLGKVEVLHITELIAEKIADGTVKFVQSFSPEITVTYHDPCRLGRYMKVYDAPRQIFNSMESIGVRFKEMERHKETALCCGVPGFMGCNDITKGIRTDRLMEAASVAQILVTTCPKCQIHFNCLLSENRENVEGKELQIEIYDIVNVVATAMGLKKTLYELKSETHQEIMKSCI